MRHMLDTRDNPYGDAPEPSELEDKVLGLLEHAGIETAICDQIMKLIGEGQRKKFTGETLAADEAEWNALNAENYG